MDHVTMLFVEQPSPSATTAVEKTGLFKLFSSAINFAKNLFRRTKSSASPFPPSAVGAYLWADYTCTSVPSPRESVADLLDELMPNRRKDLE